MKICWNMLEGLKLTKLGTFKKGSATYIYKESCVICGKPYLTLSYRQSNVCGLSCANSGKNNSNYGKIHTVETRKKMSEKASRRIGCLSTNYKGGVRALGVTTYDAYKHTLGLYEEVRKQRGTEILEVKCAYCGKWFAPTHDAIGRRLIVINSLNKGEARLYCSENCKQACPTYGQKLYPKGFKHITSREVSTYLRQMVLERDNWTCQICGKTSKEAQLHCHHMDPATQNPMFQNDMDSCITLCKGCHKMVHKQYGCRYIDLRCKTKRNIQYEGPGKKPLVTMEDPINNLPGYMKIKKVINDEERINN